jgi:DNA-binding XRE family transcriptional regulator
MGICNKIKLFRVKCGDMTQQDLAKKVGCSRQTINSIEKGKFKPSIELVLKLSRAFNCKVEELFSLDGDRNKKDE